MGAATHPAPVTDVCKRPQSPKPPASRCINPRLVCSPPRKAHSPVRERAIPRGTTAGSGGSHSVGKSGRNYFCTDVETLYERNEASAHGRYMCEFLDRAQGHHNKISVVRPDTPPTPGASGSDGRPTTPVTLGTSVVRLDTPPTPGDTSPQARPATPSTPGTPAVEDPVDGSSGSPDGQSLPSTPECGQGGDYHQSPFLSPPLSPAHEDDSPPTPGRSVTQVDWVSRSVTELQAIDPEMAAFVTECDERDAREVCATSSITGPANQGVTTPWAGGLSAQSEGIKKSFPCFWLPVSVCVASRVYLLLSTCPQSSRIDSIVPSVTVALGTETSPIVCSLTSGGLSLVNYRRKGVRAGSVGQLSPPLDKPTCEFIHCPCSVCDQFRSGPTS